MRATRTEFKEARVRATHTHGTASFSHVPVCGCVLRGECEASTEQTDSRLTPEPQPSALRAAELGSHVSQLAAATPYSASAGAGPCPHPHWPWSSRPRAARSVRAPPSRPHPTLTSSSTATQRAAHRVPALSPTLSTPDLLFVFVFLYSLFAHSPRAPENISVLSLSLCMWPHSIRPPRA